jgi:tRNA 2-selenouridine synthase
LITNLSIKEYLESVRNFPTLDVRSPSEYEHAHIPSSSNLALLNNDERKLIGTTYKNSGNQAAVIQGYQLVGPKFSQYIEEALKISPDKNINVYCWRGGLRSNIMAFVLQTAGFKVNLLKGGYKAFRNWSAEALSEERKIKVIGGKTGSGKTLIIEHLRKMSEQVINLESLANHRGSAFGSMGQVAQVSNEQFENLLAMEWKDLNPNKTLWLENESRTIGSNVIPLSIFNQMQKAITFDVQLPIEERINYIVKEYGYFNQTELANNTSKLQKRLGNLRLQQALEFLSDGNIREWAIMMLEYYDKTYIYGNSKREVGTVISMVFDKLIAEEMTRKILEWEKKND